MKSKTSIIVDTFKTGNVLSVAMPIVVIYKNPSDFPNKFVARVWEVNKPTRIAMLKDSLEEIHSNLPEGLIHFERDLDDDPCIVETWLKGW